MRAFHPRSSKDTIKLSVSVSVSQDAAPVCNALGLGQSPLVDAPYLTWALSHADGVSCDMATVNGWQRWPFFPCCSASNMWLRRSRHLPGRAWGGGWLTPVSPRTSPPLWRGSPGWLSGRARDRYDRAADKGQAARWEQHCSPTQTRLVLSSLGLQWDPQLAAEKPQPVCTESYAVSHWLPNNANHCCMDGPPKHKHRKSNAALTVCLWRKAPRFPNSADRVFCSVLDLFIVSNSPGTLTFLTSNCYQVCVETVWAERHW